MGFSLPSNFSPEITDDFKLKVTLGGQFLSRIESTFTSQTVGTIKVPYFDASINLQDAIACPTGVTGSVTISQASVVTGMWNARQEMCLSELRQKFTAQIMNGLPDNELPMEQKILDIYIDKLLQKKETLAMTGTYGVKTLLASDSNRIPLVTYVGVTASSTTIDDIVDEFISKIPAHLLWSGKVDIYMPQTWLQMYSNWAVNTFGTLALSNVTPVDGSNFSMPCVKNPKVTIVGLQSLDGTIFAFAAARDNLIKIVSNPGDAVFNMFYSEYHKKFVIDPEFILGVGYYFGDQIVTNF